MKYLKINLLIVIIIISAVSATWIGRVSDESIGYVKNHDHRSLTLKDNLTRNLIGRQI